MSTTRSKKVKAKKGRAAFKPRAKLLRMIGAELISDDVVAMTEIVKNAHDADASHVSIIFEDVASGDGVIVIEDDGDGMDLDTLLGRWMQPAGSLKGRSGVRRTRLGRRFLGEKGMGRFAVDKLAARLELFSRVRGSKEEVVARFDWDEFADDDRMLSDVRCEWEVRKAETVRDHGTILVLKGLRSRWTERSFRRLCSRLTRLLSPLDSEEGFRVVVESDDFPDYSGALKADFLDRSPYRIDASFDGLSAITFEINGERAITVPWSGRDDLRCGPVAIRIHAFDLETSSLARLGPRMEVRAWLRDWSGISVYRDGFRVWPYGEPHDDWLRLDQRRVNNPVVRLSNNQIVGFVRISQDANPELRDQTNREGLINNRALEDLRRLMYFVLERLEAERQQIRHPRGEREKRRSSKPSGATGSSSSLERLTALLEVAPAGMRKELRGAIAAVRKEMETTAAVNSQREQGLIELAVTGQAMGSLIEPVAMLAEDLRQRVEEAAEGTGSKQEMNRLRRELKSGLTDLNQRLDELRPMTGTTNRKRRTISVQPELLGYSDLIRPILDAQGIQLRIRESDDQTVRVEMRPETLTRILQVFMVNAMDWLGGIERPRVTLKLRADAETCRIVIADNGPGLPDGVGSRVLEPMVSFKEGGQGMGLALAREVIERHGGTLVVVQDRRRSGATFEIELPRKKSRSVSRSH